MKNIIPFKKDVIFKTNLSEITSISLENTLSLKKDVISGEFIVSGEYKISDKSTTVEPFELRLPFEIVIDDRYDSSRASIDIDDFYYEIVNNNILSVSIDVLVDRLQEKPLIELEDLVDVTPVRTIIDSEDDIMYNTNDIRKEDVKEAVIEETEEIKKSRVEEVRNSTEDKKQEEIKELEKERNEKEFVEEKINSLFNQFSKDSEVYVTYNVFILRDGDSLDTIMEKYNISQEELEKYNDLSNLQLGDKIIIPNTYERN